MSGKAKDDSDLMYPATFRIIGALELQGPSHGLVRKACDKLIIDLQEDKKHPRSEEFAAKDVARRIRDRFIIKLGFDQKGQNLETYLAEGKGSLTRYLPPESFNVSVGYTPKPPDNLDINGQAVWKAIREYRRMTHGHNSMFNMVSRGLSDGFKGMLNNLGGIKIDSMGQSLIGAGIRLPVNKIMPSNPIILGRFDRNRTDLFIRHLGEMIGDVSGPVILGIVEALEKGHIPPKKTNHEILKFFGFPPTEHIDST